MSRECRVRRRSGADVLRIDRRADGHVARAVLLHSNRVERDVGADLAAGRVCLEGTVALQEAVTQARVQLLQRRAAAVAGQVRWSGATMTARFAGVPSAKI